MDQAAERAATPEGAARLARAIRVHVEEHTDSVSGVMQWYVDKHVIDCDAGEFWRVVERAIEAAPENGNEAALGAYVVVPLGGDHWGVRHAECAEKSCRDGVVRA